MDTRHELVPLELAVRGLCRRLYPGRATTQEQLNAMADAVAALVPIHTQAADGSGLRRVQPQEITEGLFRDGGRRMIFVDDRAPLERLAVECSRLEAAERALSSRDER